MQGELENQLRESAQAVSVAAECVSLLDAAKQKQVSQSNGKVS